MNEEQTVLPDIPEDWQVRDIGDVVERTQYGISESMSKEGNYPIFRMNNIEGGYMVDEPMKYIDLDKDGFEKYRVNKGDLLFNRTNSIKYVGQTGYFELDEEFVFASYLIRLDPDDSINNLYLNFYMNSKKGQDRLKAFATRGVGQANINATNLQKVLLPFPPLSEQRRIASVLYTVDQILETLHERQEWLEQHKQGLMQDLLTGYTKVTPEMGINEGIVLSPSKIVENREWEEKRFTDLFIIESKSYKPDEHNEMVFHYSMPAFDDGKPIKEHTSNIGSTKRIVPDETILFPKLNIRKKRFWFVNKESELPKICSTEYWPLLPRDGEDIFLPFYHQYFQSDKFCDSPLLSTSSSTNSHQRVKRNLVKLEELPVPPLWEQERIASVLYTVDKMIEKTNNLIEEHERLKRGLMQDLLSGDVRTPSDLPVMDSVEA